MTSQIIMFKCDKCGNTHADIESARICERSHMQRFKSPDEFYKDQIMNKTLHNSTVSGAKKNVSDLITFGDGDTFKLICKASSKEEGWMKSTKAMEVVGVGCVIQVTTQQGDNIAEALTFVPGVKIALIDGDKSNGRIITAI